MSYPMVFGLWELMFFPADRLPEEDSVVLCSDGEEVATGYVHVGRWHRETGEDWPEVIGWADLPDAWRCVLDLVRAKNPRCPRCKARMLRWAWYEAPNEPFKWWYCLECDKSGREPCIRVLPA